MSERALKRIEKVLEGIQGDLAQLCARVDALASPGGSTTPTQSELLAYLDQFRAAEALALLSGETQPTPSA